MSAGWSWPVLVNETRAWTADVAASRLINRGNRSNSGDGLNHH